MIDSDYRGNVGVPLINDSDEIQIVKAHERIAQIVFMPVPEANLYEITGELKTTARGKGGFGSTGR